MAHGVLFIAYCIWVILVGLEKKWNFTTLLLAGFASLIPFGTFIADAKIFKKQ
jgi:integral membrane protein